MELQSQVSTSLAPNQERPSGSAAGAPTSPDDQLHYYPLPTPERAPRGVAKPNIINMAGPRTNGSGPMAGCPDTGSVSPRSTTVPKTVTFELLVNATQSRARLPLRVSIYPHDTTDSIVTTVKNFYGLYTGPSVSKGVSFEDDRGNTLIARYENFSDQMTVSVRVIEDPIPGGYGAAAFHSPPMGVPGYFNDAYPMPAPQQYDHHMSRPASRASRMRSSSPNSGRGRRSASAGTNPPGSKTGRSRSARNRVQPNGDSKGDFNGYSSGDGAPSATSRSRDHLGNTEISVENIVEGGRRKRAKFESSELPLFAPPQMPAATSNSSVSPARRADHRNSLPLAPHGQNPFSNPRPLQSPQGYTNGYTHQNMYATPSWGSRRTRGSSGYPYGSAAGPGADVAPTPDPTIGSSMSEEDKDVALQLMRLGGMSNMSHGRTSASTHDDTFSGRADAASSTGATSDAESESEGEAPPSRRQKLDAFGNHKKVFVTTESHFVGPQDSAEASADEADAEDTERGTMAAPKLKSPKPKGSSVNGAKPRPQVASKTKTAKQAKPKLKKVSAPNAAGPMSPASLPASRKQSVVSNTAFPLAAGEDEQPDLSTKPRCQRCRKSKKGCDRQRPCGRCRDAGIPADQCISEDEGNGRKGRYGRHMGVPIQKDEAPISGALLPPAPIAAAADTALSLNPLDKNKKRKR